MPSGMRRRDLKGSASNQFVADDTPGELQAQVRDIINYICAALIYGNQVYENRVIVGLVEGVRESQISLAEALKQFP